MAFISFRDVQSTCKEKNKSLMNNVSQLSSIVISEAANKRNNTMEMDLYSNTLTYALHFSQGKSEPAFFSTLVFLLLM